MPGKSAPRKLSPIKRGVMYKNIHLSRFRLLKCLSRFVEALQSEQAVDQITACARIVRGHVEAFAVSLPCRLMLPLKAVHKAHIDSHGQEMHWLRRERPTAAASASAPCEVLHCKALARAKPRWASAPVQQFQTMPLWSRIF